MRPDQIETLEAWANNWDEGPKALTLALIADWRKRGEALEPFARLLTKDFPDIDRYSDESGCLIPINVAMVRRARAALKGNGEG